jgi:hypothetical protein
VPDATETAETVRTSQPKTSGNTRSSTSTPKPPKKPHCSSRDGTVPDETSLVVVGTLPLPAWPAGPRVRSSLDLSPSVKSQHDNTRVWVAVPRAARPLAPRRRCRPAPAPAPAARALYTSARPPRAALPAPAFRAASPPNWEESEGKGDMGSPGAGSSGGHECSFKFLLIGDSGVGKSSLLVSFVAASHLDGDIAPTIGTPSIATPRHATPLPRSAPSLAASRRTTTPGPRRFFIIDSDRTTRASAYAPSSGGITTRIPSGRSHLWTQKSRWPPCASPSHQEDGAFNLPLLCHRHHPHGRKLETRLNYCLLFFFFFIPSPLSAALLITPWWAMYKSCVPILVSASD